MKTLARSLVTLSAAAAVVLGSAGAASAATVSFADNGGSVDASLSFSGKRSFSFSGKLWDRSADGYNVKLQMQLDRSWTVGDSHWFDVASGNCRTYSGAGTPSLSCTQGNPGWNGADVHGVRLRICKIKSGWPDDCGSARYYDSAYA